jgi:15-cis-phytoene synthase/lycopene beta-cyclase
MFFILQPILVILLYCLVQHPDLLPFEVQLDLDAQLGPLDRGVAVDASQHGEKSDLGSKSLDRVAATRQLDRSVSTLSPNIQRGALRTSSSRPRSDEDDTIQTLPHRPLAASLWALSFLLGLSLVLEAHDLSSGLAPIRAISGALGISPNKRLGMRAFYLGWILIWISPVIGFLTFLGAKTGRAGRRTQIWGGAYLCLVDA